MIWTGPVQQEKPQYTEEELERYEKRGAKIADKGWLQSGDGRLLIPENAQWKSFPKAMELTNYVTQLSAFQQALKEFQEVTADPASESGKPLFEPGTKVLIKNIGTWEPISRAPLGRPLPGYSFFSHSCQSSRNGFVDASYPS